MKTDKLRCLRKLPSAAADFRAELDGKKPKLGGYAARFYDPKDDGTQYDFMGDGTVMERIMPTAFDRALNERHDVLALFNHDESAILGRSESGTLRLKTDKRGLHYEVDVPDTQLGRDVTELVRRGDLGGSSFAFIPTEITFIDEDARTVVEIRDLRLFDVSVVGRPAYRATSVDLERKAAEINAYVRHLEQFRSSNESKRTCRMPFGDPVLLQWRHYWDGKALEQERYRKMVIDDSGE